MPWEDKSWIYKDLVLKVSSCQFGDKMDKFLKA